ncbi:plasmid mobilization protein [Pseudoflavonifractor phocaeensis]|uniref:plasmid mobilization protein n=1 Tax=Pseudoflavonifractor phocaeensis TaxID=1870988 RepID=UPI0019581280|nr:ribbon-helix-helix protein, CopG family [Pseudoflavonifractor phocaeensis]MBM6927330.1 ribbon-helix-helix protein, CopG family [Pseudoflavonifractor phocaeensis]
MKSLQSSEVKSKTVKARVTEEEYRTFCQKREECGLSESELIRRAIFGLEVSGCNAKNQKAMEHMCKIHTLLNQARLEMDDAVIDALQEEVSDLCQSLS